MTAVIYPPQGLAAIYTSCCLHIVLPNRANNDPSTMAEQENGMREAGTPHPPIHCVPDQNWGPLAPLVGILHSGQQLMWGC